MTEFIVIATIVSLVAVIIVQGVERYFYAEQVQREQARLIAAILSKDIGEYTHAVRVDKEKKAPVFAQDDSIPLSESSDEVFDKFIKTQLQDQEE